MRRCLLRTASALVLAAMCAHASWTDPAPLGSLKVLTGCGADSGASIQLFSLANATYFQRSSSPLSRIGNRLLLAAATEGCPAQAFALMGLPTATYQAFGDDGACHTSNAVEALGVALDRKSATTGVAVRNSRLEVRRLDGNRLFVPGQGELSVWSPNGARYQPSISPSNGGQVLDLSSLPSGPLFLRTGNRTISLARF